MERALLEPVETSRAVSPPLPVGRLSPGVAEAVHRIRRDWDGVPASAIVLGTGLGRLAEMIDAEAVIPFRSIPGFPSCTALAHKGQLVCGRLMNVPVVAQQGRCHMYEGYSFEELKFAVRVMAALGSPQLIVSNAAGGVNPRFSVGDVMLIEDHVNLMFPSTKDVDVLAEKDGQHVEGRALVNRRHYYSRELFQSAVNAALLKRVPIQTGVYVGVTGPNYETRAEYRLFRKLGGDAVGMSTIPEVIAAAECGMSVLGFSAITNVAKPDAPDVVDAHEVLDVAELAAPKIQQIVMTLLSKNS